MSGDLEPATNVGEIVSRTLVDAFALVGKDFPVAANTKILVAESEPVLRYQLVLLGSFKESLVAFDFEADGTRPHGNLLVRYAEGNFPGYNARLLAFDTARALRGRLHGWTIDAHVQRGGDGNAEPVGNPYAASPYAQPPAPRS